MSLRRAVIATVPPVAMATLVLLAATLITVRSTSAQSADTPTCSTGAAVPDPANNPGLVSDCEALLASWDTQTLAVPTAPGGVNYEESRPDGLFYEVDGEPLPSNGVDALDSRLVGIDLGQLSEVTKSHISPKGPVKGQPSTPQKLILNLFDDVVFTGIVEHVEPTASGHALWGRLEGVELGTMTMVVNGKVVVGTVRTPNEVYSIRTASDNKYVIRQIDESSLPPLGEPFEDPASTRDYVPKPGGTPLDDGSVVDVMVVYTPLAKHIEGGRAGIEALIDLFVAETNQAYANSEVVHRIRLVHREEVDFVETGRCNRDIHRIGMDDVQELRDKYAADLVHFVVGRGDICGVSVVIEGSTFLNVSALTVSRCGGIAFAHEHGHNMGVDHDRYVVEGPGTRYNYGYVNQRMFEPGAPVSSRWKTIMAYSNQCSEVGNFNCPTVAYFSNPDLTYNGDPLGVPADHPSTGVDGPADAVRTLNERSEVIANLRRSAASPTPRAGLTLSPYWLSEMGGTTNVTATLHRPSSEDTVITLAASPSDAVILSGDRTLTIPAGQRVSVDTVTITGVDNYDQTGDVIVTVSATALNSSSVGVIAPEPVELAVVDDETTPKVTLTLSPLEVVEGEGRDGGRALLVASLDNRSSAETVVTVSVSPAEAAEVRGPSPLIIPPGQTASDDFVWIYPKDDTEFTESKKSVTVSGTATNPLGVSRPDDVTLTIVDDDGPLFAEDSISYTFTLGVAGSRTLPEAMYGNGTLTYSLSPAPSNGLSFVPGSPAQLKLASTGAVAGETTFTLTATDADGDTDSMEINIAVAEGVCPGSIAVSGYTNPSIVGDCEALVISRDVLRGGQTLNWNVDLSMDDWQGVAIADSRVVGIDLSDLGLTGTIPAELGSLTDLQSLNLNSNKLRGSIPAELGNLSNLQELTAYDNQLTGEIPRELGNLASLQSLSFNINELTGAIPTELGDLSSLTRLQIGGNKLTGGIPTELGRLANLQSLYLPANQLTGTIPAELRDLGKLEYLDANNNMLDGEIPLELGNLARLEVLNFNSNRLTGTIPPELGNLSNLYALYLAHNQLSGEIPKELADLSNLRTLFIYNDGITGCIPEELHDVKTNDLDNLGLPFCDAEVQPSACSMGAVPDPANNPGLVSDCEALLASRDTLAGDATLDWSADRPIEEWEGVAVGGTPQRITRLQLHSKGLNGEIPPELGSLVHLQALDLSSNDLTGQIPPELGDLATLLQLWLNRNKLTGQIPSELGSLSNLQELGLGLNDLSGSIPPELGNLSNLREIWINDTNVTGEIPSELGDLSNLEEFFMYQNALTGRIPPELGKLTNLRILFLSNNRLTGDIPSELCNLTDLISLNLRGNRLTGNIPPELGNLSLLTYLALGGNQLTGKIPSELGELTNLQQLRFSINRLSGNIPSELGRLSNLQVLSLFENKLSGNIPSELGNLSNLLALDLSRNDLSGEIPTKLADLSKLEVLILSENELNEEIPPELGSLTYLKQLYLHSNQLMGEIPSELGSLSHLEQLFLRDNRLHGPIPAELINLGKLTDLGLSENQLTGCVPDGLRVVPEHDFANLLLPFCSNHTCFTAGAVNDVNNPGLISDCEALVAAGDILVGVGATRSLNWVANIPITDWYGVVLSGAPQRVTRLRLPGHNANLDKGLTEFKLMGSIPPELGRLTMLTELNLRTNDLSGRIPSELGNLRNLDSLNLHTNKLTGRIIDLSRITGLEELYLSNNELSGGVPTWLNTMTNLKELWLWGNELSGTIPDLSGMTNLHRLKLQSNHLTEGIPKWFGTMTDLRYLYLHANPLAGEIPSELGNMTNLRYLWLHSTRLTGMIPPELGSLSNLVDLNLHDNNLTGGIPAELGEMTNLTRLRLHRNALTGNIPVELGDLENLRSMWLQGNMLGGQIPAEFGSLTNLEHLWLSENNLSGPIPTELGELGSHSLVQWRLADNQLSGCVPPGLAAIEDSDFTGLGLEVCEDS